MALDFPNSPTVGQEFTGGGFTWTWTGTTWSKVAAVAGGENNFALLVGSTGNKTYVLDRTYQSGAYTVTFVNGDNTYDIYAVAENGTYAGYTNNGRIDISADFAEIVVLGAANNERILFTYQGAITSPTTAGDVPVAGAYVTAVGTSSLPNVNDTTTITGGNFATDVAVAFIGQDANALAAKNVVRSSSTSLIATRPDAFTTAQSPYSVRVLNPGIAAPTGSNVHILSNAVTAGTNPVWVTTGPLLYNIGAASPAITLVATDTEGSDIDYTVVSGTIPAGLTLDSETGVITGTFSGSASEGDTNTVTFRATDAGGNYLDKALDFVANAAPIWTTAAGALANAAENGAYSVQLAASTGTAGGALSYSVQSGALLAGLTLNSTGLISGTNSATAGTVGSFTIRVTDAAGLYADRAFTITSVVPGIASRGTFLYRDTSYSSSDFHTQDAAVASDLSLYSLGVPQYNVNNSASWMSSLMKQSANGNVAWTKNLIHNDQSAYSLNNGEALGLDESDIPYQVNSLKNASNSNKKDLTITKINPSTGATTYQSRILAADLAPNYSDSFEPKWAFPNASQGKMFVVGEYTSGNRFLSVSTIDTNNGNLLTHRVLRQYDASVPYSGCYGATRIGSTGNVVTSSGSWNGQSALTEFDINGNIVRNVEYQTNSNIRNITYDSVNDCFYATASTYRVAKFDRSLNLVWVKTVAESGSGVVFDNGNLQVRNGNIFLTRIDSPSIFIIKMDTDGNIVTSKRMVFAGTYQSSSMTLFRSNGIQSSGNNIVINLSLRINSDTQGSGVSIVLPLALDTTGTKTFAPRGLTLEFGYSTSTTIATGSLTTGTWGWTDNTTLGHSNSSGGLTTINYNQEITPTAF